MPTSSSLHAPPSAMRDILDMRPASDPASLVLAPRWCEVNPWRPPRDRKFSAASRRAIEIVMVMELTTNSARHRINALLSYFAPAHRKKYLPGLPITAETAGSGPSSTAHRCSAAKVPFAHNGIEKPYDGFPAGRSQKIRHTFAASC